jgi:hypothetical protein
MKLWNTQCESWCPQKYTHSEARRRRSGSMSRDQLLHLVKQLNLQPKSRNIEGYRTALESFSGNPSDWILKYFILKLPTQVCSNASKKTRTDIPPTQGSTKKLKRSRKARQRRWPRERKLSQEKIEAVGSASRTSHWSTECIRWTRWCSGCTSPTFYWNTRPDGLGECFRPLKAAVLRRMLGAECCCYECQPFESR